MVNLGFGIIVWLDCMFYMMRIFGFKVVCFYKIFLCLVMIYLINRLWKDKVKYECIIIYCLLNLFMFFGNMIVGRG